MAMATLKICVSRRVLSQLPVKEYFVAKRSNHTLLLRCCNVTRVVTKRNTIRTIYPAASVRWGSQTSTEGPINLTQVKSPIIIDETTLPPIPTAPPPVAETADIWVQTAEVAAALTAGGEPPLSSYGLAGWSPVGMAQQCLEYLHVTADLPWWGAVVVGTMVLRTAVFPLVIKAQRNAAKMANNMPQFQRLQEKMSEARQSGNQFEAARLGQEMMEFMKEKKLNPIANLLPPLAQAPLFISMFMALRGMCNVPVESLQTGGILWFVDLTVPDQYYLLPIVTSLTLAATIEVGTDSARAASLGMIRYALRAMPVLIFPFTMNFPGAILCYWVSTNFISLVQVSILRIPRVRNYFNIEPIIPQPADVTAKKKGFVEGFKESMTNMKITRQLNEREHADFARFQKAGRAPIMRTFKHDPTLPRPKTTTELLAKKKN